MKFHITSFRLPAELLSHCDIFQNTVIIYTWSFISKVRKEKKAVLFLMNETGSRAIAVMFITCRSAVLTPLKVTTQWKSLSSLYQGMSPHEDEDLLLLLLKDEEAEESKRSLLWSWLLQCSCISRVLQILYQPSMDLLGTTAGAPLVAHVGGCREHHGTRTERLFQGPVAPGEEGSLLCYREKETATLM